MGTISKPTATAEKVASLLGGLPQTARRAAPAALRAPQRPQHQPNPETIKWGHDLVDLQQQIEIKKTEMGQVGDDLVTLAAQANERIEQRISEIAEAAHRHEGYVNSARDRLLDLMRNVQEFSPETVHNLQAEVLRQRGEIAVLQRENKRKDRLMAQTGGEKHRYFTVLGGAIRSDSDLLTECIEAVQTEIHHGEIKPTPALRDLLKQFTSFLGNIDEFADNALAYGEEMKARAAS